MTDPIQFISDANKLAVAAIGQGEPPLRVVKALIAKMQGLKALLEQDAPPLVKSVWEGKVRFGSIEMDVHVLDNGDRVIEEDSFLRFWNALDGGIEVTPDDATQLAKFLQGGGIPQ